MFYSKLILVVGVLHLPLFSLQAALIGQTSLNVSADGHCRNIPGDSAWPSPQIWNGFNRTVAGRLIRTVPVGSPCHDPNFNAKACAAVQANWRSPDFHDESSSSVMFSNFANKSCDPFTGRQSQCVIGTYVQYAVDVSTPAHVIETVKFANKHNVRFVVRNTGHDLLGKSTGTGALAVWMHHLKDIEWITNFKSPIYTGPAVKMAAGVQAAEIYAQADARGSTVVAGGFPTVGIAAGYIQGGGHSLLSSIYGLAADQTLEFKVITTTGKFVTASPSQNSDLYWALNGGGGSSYGIVWSVTVKVYPSIPVTAAGITIVPGGNISMDDWWSAVNFYQASIPEYTAAGAYSVAIISQQNGLILRPIFVPNKTVSQVSKMLQPFRDFLSHNLSISADFEINTYPRFLPAFNAELAVAATTVGGKRLTSRLLPKSLWDTKKAFNSMTDTVRKIVEGGGVLADISLSAVNPSPHSANQNAVLPAWRDTRRHLVVDLFYNDTETLEQIEEKSLKLTNVFGKQLRELAPTSGAYLNEADVFEPNWQKSFYGTNYRKLLEIKDKWDPDQILYAPTAVGSSDRWVPNELGALCRVN